MKKVFIDGSVGTTGLRIFERLGKREDIALITLPEEKRKDVSARKEAINSADIVFLCLPDDAARESVSLLENDNTVIIDTSTAHRTDENWTYGFPELKAEIAQKLPSSKKIAVPGCHASGVIALVYPLIEAGILDSDALLCVTSVTGYSGGGKKMIAEYEADEIDKLFSAPRQYGLTQQHKHLKEIKAIASLDNAPAFSPIVSSFYSGMCVTIPLFKSQLKNGATIDDIKNIYSKKYNGPVVSYKDEADESGFISANKLSGLDSMEIAVFGNEERILLAARYDNLGKGASGAAVQCMNICMGADETTGLSI